MGYSTWGRKELDRTEQLTCTTGIFQHILQFVTEMENTTEHEENPAADQPNRRKGLSEARAQLLKGLVQGLIIVFLPDA